MAAESLGGAGLGALGGLLGGILQARAAKDAQLRDEGFQMQMAKQAATNQAMQNQAVLAGQAGDREQGALAQLLGVISRTVR